MTAEERTPGQRSDGAEWPWRALLAGALLWLVLVALAVSVVTSRWMLVVVLAVWMAIVPFAFAPAESEWLRTHASCWIRKLTRTPWRRMLAALVVVAIGAGLASWRGRVLETDAMALGFALWAVGLLLTVGAHAFAKFNRRIWILGTSALLVTGCLVSASLLFRLFSVSVLSFVVGAGVAAAVACRFVGDHVLAEERNARPRQVKLQPRHFAQEDEDRRRHTTIDALRSLAWVGASGFVLASACVVAVDVEAAAPSQIGRFGADLQAPSDETALAQFYSPVLRLAKGETWRAADPTAVLKSDALAEPPVEECPTSAEAPCDTVRIADESALAQVQALVPKPGVFAGGYAFPHIVDTRAESRMFAKGSLPARTAKVIEYWLYYAGDAWSTQSALGQITQGHDGDWEWVGVGVDGAGQALFTAYSAHCGGVWRPWSFTWVAAESEDRSSVVLPGTGDSTPLASGQGSAPSAQPQLSHPLIAVAKGSHANYPTSAARAPDWIGCTQVSGTAATAFDGLSNLANVRESISDFGSTQIPSVATVDSGTLYLPLTWGPADIKTVDGFAFPPAGGPDSPVYHTEFKTPLQVVFNRRTDADGHRINTHWSCDLKPGECPRTG